MPAGMLNFKRYFCALALGLLVALASISQAEQKNSVPQTSHDSDVSQCNDVTPDSDRLLCALVERRCVVSRPSADLIRVSC